MQVDYSIIKTIHITGFILLGGGLIGVFAADLRSRQKNDIVIFAEACRFVAILYDGVVVPGAILAGFSGLGLILKMNAGFFEFPWLTGMWALFAFEFVEGNTITRIHFRRMLRLSGDALAQGNMTPELKKEQARRLPAFTHYLDLPLFFLIVSFGGLRPLSWNAIALGVMLALAAGTALYVIFTSIYKIEM